MHTYNIYIYIIMYILQYACAAHCSVFFERSAIQVHIVLVTPIFPPVTKLMLVFLSMQCGSKSRLCAI